MKLGTKYPLLIIFRYGPSQQRPLVTVPPKWQSLSLNANIFVTICSRLILLVSKYTFCRPMKPLKTCKV